MNSLFLASSLLALSAFKCDAYTQKPLRHPMATSPQNRSNISSRSTTKDDNITTRDVLSLSSIRSSLIRQEETIIFALIERAQFRRNEVVYEVGGVPGLGWPQGARLISESEGGGDALSFLDFMLIGTVSLDESLRALVVCAPITTLIVNQFVVSTQEVLHSAVRRYESPEEHGESTHHGLVLFHNSYFLLFFKYCHYFLITLLKF